MKKTKQIVDYELLGESGVLGSFSRDPLAVCLKSPLERGLFQQLASHE